MDTVPITPNLTMLRVNGWQLYIWRDDDSVTDRHRRARIRH